MAGGRIKGITVEIGGDTQGLDKALKGVNDTSRNLQKELRDVQRLLKFDPENVELLAQQQQLLGEQVENTEKKLRQLKDAQADVQAQFERGDIGADQYRAFQREIQATEGYLNDLRKKMDTVDDSNAPKQAADEIDKIETEARQATDAVKKMGSAMGTAGKGLAAGAAAGAAGIAGLVTGTQELNQDLAKLRFNAFNEGFDSANVEAGFQRIVAISGEADSAVETVSNLMQTGFSDEQLSQAIDHVNGAAIQFSDTLNTEGIADGIQETFATGGAVGMFGELLERSGVNLDDFNAGLAEAKKNGTETDYVLQQMSDLGLAGVAEGFKEMNPEIMAQNEAQIKLQTALAALGVALTPLMTLVTNFATKMAEWGLENINLVTSFDSIAEGITALLPQLFGKGLQLITTIVQAIIENLPMILQTGTQILLQLITGIIQMLPSLMAQVQTLLPLVSSILQQNLPLILSAGIQLLITLINGIVSMLPDIIRMALDLIVLIAKELLKHLPMIIDAGIELIFALIDGIVDTIPDIIDAIVFDVIPAILKAFNEIDLTAIGEDIMQGLIDGITNMAENVWKAAKNVASGIGKKVASILKLGSPSKVMINMGQDTGEGLAIGIKDSMRDIRDVSEQMARAAIPNNLNDDEVDFKRAAGSRQSAAGMVVNINSPKALDAREATRVWNRTLRKMQLQW